MPTDLIYYYLAARSLCSSHPGLLISLSFPNTPGLLLPQGLCACYSLPLNHSYLRYSHGSLPQLLYVSLKIFLFP